MDAREYLRAGDLPNALEVLKQEVRKAPRDPRLRVFLFQMFCITAEWDRALAQLTVASELDPLAVPMRQTYRVLIACERDREAVFAGKRGPTLLGAPAAWVPALIEANRRLAAGEPAAAARLRDDAFEAAPASSGGTDQGEFAWIADADPRLGPVLEAIVDGTYYWVPFVNIRHIEIEAPADLRDQVWMPATLRWANDGESVGFIPTRYVGSGLADDPLIRLSRRTEWNAVGEADDGWMLGIGQRMLVTDSGELALMDLRRLYLGGGETGTREGEGQSA